MGSISVDIDIYEVIWGMSKWDRKEFFLEMQKEGHISELCVITNDGEVKAAPHIERNAENASKDEFNLALQKLFNNGWKLTKEEEEYVIGLSKKIP